MDRHQRLVFADIGGAVELPPDVGLADTIRVESLDVQSVGMAQSTHRNVQAGQARGHLRAVAAHAHQMHRHATLQQLGMNQVFHQRLPSNVLYRVSRAMAERQPGGWRSRQRRSTWRIQPSPRSSVGAPCCGHVPCGSCQGCLSSGW